MNAWAAKRKRVIMLIVLAFLVVVIGVPGYFLFYHTPTCTDGKQNGDETGVDCGGSCKLLCAPEALPLLSQGDPRVVTVATSTYEVVAVFKNPNPTASVYRASYIIRLYGADRQMIKRIDGSTYIPKDSQLAIFEGPFNESSSTPVSATLEWGNMTWLKDPNPAPDISVSDATLSGADSLPRLQATARNNSLADASNVEFTAVILDASGNIIAASKTYLDSLSSGGTETILFSWPRPLAGDPVSISIIPRAYPDSSFIK